MSQTAPKSLVSLLSAANFVIGMGAFVVIGLLEPLAADLSVTPARAGVLMTVYALSYAVLSPVLVSITGQIGRRRVLAAAFGLFLVANALSALATSEALLWASRLLAAAGAGMFTPVAAAVVAGLTAPEARGRVLAAVFFGLTLAQVIGVPLGSYVGYTYGWRPALWIVVLLGMPMLALIWMRVPAGLRFQPVALGDLGAVLVTPHLMLAVGFTSVFLGGVYVLYTYLAPLLGDVMGFDGGMISLALLVFGIGAVIGNILGGRMADGLGAARTLAILSVAQAAIMPLFFFLPFAMPAAFALILIWSISGWSFMAAQQSRLIALSPVQAPVLLALNAAAIYVGAALGSALGGVVLEAGGYGPLGVVGGGVALFAFAMVFAPRKVAA
ncbi:MFS transporter [Nereida sp. MMG025]|uniref:MFS transporter n=1 Tax=Nereida sp. MMG025 TaxID=2909981 RepID=UPI001F18AC07|nr:MFS transporter [Nereida sp. MMG025]MCF6443989.1 MFS transporter [Nereida sp. MMG025]